MRRGPSTVLSAVLLLCAMRAYADDRDTAMARLFDRPLATQTVLAKSDAEEGNELRCTYYPDFLVREKGTDTPAPADAVIISIAKTAARPPCKTANGTTVPLKTENYSLVGRKGGYLVFQATDPNGAVPFVVIDAASGKTIYTDSMVEDRIQAVTLADGVLHLKFTHGVNGSCSLMAGAPACWSKLVADGTIPSDIGQTPLSSQACIAAYRRAKAPADDPSIISFDLDMTLDQSGSTKVIARGKPACSPMP